MKTHLRTFAAFLGIVVGIPAMGATSTTTPANSEKKTEMRVLAGPDRPPRGLGPRGEKRDDVEKEIVAFLGVETTSVSPTLSAQLNLPKSSGLVVNHVLPKSPADGVLNQHDILLKLDDQILIEMRQLSVLIRSRKEGDEVTVTYLRAGQRATAKIKLGRQEVPKFSALTEPAVRRFGFPPGEAGRFEMLPLLPAAPEGREEMDRLLSLLRRARGAPDAGPGTIPPAARIRIDRSGGPGIRAMSVNTGNSNIVYSDDAGSLDLSSRDGAKTLVANNAAGEQVFSGPVTTPADREAMPPEIRERLEKLEGMQDVTFHTDGDFQGAETKIMRPPGRAISLPYYAPREGRPPFYF